MPAKPCERGNKISVKKLCLWGIFTALCICFGFLESLLPFDFIAPGVKIGLSNSVALLLVCFGDTKGAFAVNIVRILLCALLFGNPFSLLFSLPAGIISLLCTFLLYKTDKFSLVGISLISATVHNTVQLAVAVLTVGTAVLFYLPVLLLCGTLSGAFLGFICTLILKKIKKL